MSAKKQTVGESRGRAKARARSAGRFAAACLMAIAAAGAQLCWAAKGSAGAYTAQWERDYREQASACGGPDATEDRQTCLKEARAAAAEMRRGRLDEASADYSRNAQARCDVFRDGEQKAACQARAMGYGEASGSVAGGGVLREVETVVAPAGGGDFAVDAKTPDPVVLVPMERAPRPQ